MKPAVAVLIVLSLALLAAAPARAAALGPDAVVEGYFDAYRARDLERMVGAYTPDAVFVDVAQRHEYQGADEMRQLLGGLVDMHTTMAVEVQRRVASGNLVVVDYLYTGTLSGEALRALTGKETCQDTTYRIPVTSWFEVQDGKIRRQTDFIDLATLNEVRERASGATSP